MASIIFSVLRKLSKKALIILCTGFAFGAIFGFVGTISIDEWRYRARYIDMQTIKENLEEKVRIKGDE